MKKNLHKSRKKGQKKKKIIKNTSPSKEIQGQCLLVFVDNLFFKKKNKTRKKQKYLHMK